MTSVAVAMTLYNDAQFLQRALDSVLGQTYQDFTLYVFDNHSPDPRVDQILTAYAKRFPRMVRVTVPPKLQGIGLMRFWWDYLAEHGSHDYLITIGGHDCWNKNTHLGTLAHTMRRAIEFYAQVGGAPVLVYSDTWQVNHNDELCTRYHEFHQFVAPAMHIAPVSVITTVSSPQLFGLWNEKLRRKLKVRYLCSGWDHLIVTEAAQLGHILYEPEAQLVMRMPKPDDCLPKYGLRHLTDEQRAQGMRDFIEQLEWLRHIQAVGTATLPPEQQQTYGMLLNIAVTTAYIALRGHNLQIVPGALEEFRADPKVNEFFGRLTQAEAACQSFVSRVTK